MCTPVAVYPYTQPVRFSQALRPEEAEASPAPVPARQLVEGRRLEAQEGRRRRQPGQLCPAAAAQGGGQDVPANAREQQVPNELLAFLSRLLSLRRLTSRLMCVHRRPCIRGRRRGGAAGCRRRPTSRRRERGARAVRRPRRSVSRRGGDIRTQEWPRSICCFGLHDSPARVVREGSRLAADASWSVG